MASLNDGILCISKHAVYTNLVKNSLSQYLFTLTGLEDSELESMALHETQDSKVFQSFKEHIANEPEQVSCGIYGCCLDLWRWYYDNEVLSGIA